MTAICDKPIPPALHGPAVRCTRHQLEVCDPGCAGRSELEHFIRGAFASRHGAMISTFMPTLLALRGDDGKLCGAAGFRCAADQPLFLEHYFDEPIERVMALTTGRSIERGQIVEAGNLAGTSCRAACRLVFQLPQILLERGHPWIVFTATDAIRKLLDAYRAPVFELAPARAARVATLGDDWGRYYEADPRVMAAYLPSALGLRRARR